MLINVVMWWNDAICTCMLHMNLFSSLFLFFCYYYSLLLCCLLHDVVCSSHDTSRKCHGSVLLLLCVLINAVIWWNDSIRACMLRVSPFLLPLPVLLLVLITSPLLLTAYFCLLITRHTTQMLLVCFDVVYVDKCCDVVKRCYMYLHAAYNMKLFSSLFLFSCYY